MKTLSYDFKKKENIPTITYKLGNTIRINILNDKDIENSN